MSPACRVEGCTPGGYHIRLLWSQSGTPHSRDGIHVGHAWWPHYIGLFCPPRTSHSSPGFGWKAGYDREIARRLIRESLRQPFACFPGTGLMAMNGARVQPVCADSFGGFPSAGIPKSQQPRYAARTHKMEAGVTNRMLRTLSLRGTVLIRVIYGALLRHIDSGVGGSPGATRRVCGGTY